MSDVMLHGVLNMPADLWLDCEIDKMQRQGRYVEASKRILELEAENERLKVFALAAMKEAGIDLSIDEYTPPSLSEFLTIIGA